MENHFSPKASMRIPGALWPELASVLTRAMDRPSPWPSPVPEKSQAPVVSSKRELPSVVGKSEDEFAYIDEIDPEELEAMIRKEIG
ncbi:MAG: hypothetical protein V2B19_24105 [Pseudomonadota bacterium]